MGNKLFRPFGEWAPDSPDYMSKGNILLADNVIPTDQGYLPTPSGVVWSDALDSECLGTQSFLRPDGTVFTFAGTADKLFLLNSQTWTDVSGAVYTGVGQTWRFVQWGDFVFATDYNDKIQKFQMGVDTVFSDLAATAPHCKDMTIVNEFLVLANTIDTIDGTRENRIWWSPIGDPFGTWTPNATTLCDFQDLNDGNFCVGIAGGETGTIMMKNAIIRMTFVEAPLVFQINTVIPARGALNLQSFVQNASDIFFLSEDGFYLFNGQTVTPIGDKKVDVFFYNDVDNTYLDKIRACVDIIKKNIIWAYAGKGNGGIINKYLLYNWTTNKWASGSISIVQFSSLLSQGYTLDGLDAISTNIDTGIPVSLDSFLFKGGFPVLAGIGTDNRLYYFSGTNNDATIITGEFQLTPGKRTSLQRARMLIDGGTAHTIQHEGRQSLSDPITYSGTSAQTSIGDYSFRNSNRYHRFRFNLTGQWTHVQGVDIEFVEEGER